jgi:hypothetical protein
VPAVRLIRAWGNAPCKPHPFLIFNRPFFAIIPSMERVPKPRGIFFRLSRIALVLFVLAYLGLCLLVFSCQRLLIYHPVIRTPMK